MPPPTRIAPAAPGLTSRGSAKALPSGPVTQTFSPGSSAQRRSVPGPMPSTRKSSRTPLAAGPISATEIARGRKGLSPAPAQLAAAAEHVELARSWLGALAVEQGEDAVAVRGSVLSDLAESPAERCRHRASMARAAPCISWMLRTSASPWRPAAIARAAAVAPVIVVTQGMPWRTAAVRIS